MPTGLTGHSVIAISGVRLYFLCRQFWAPQTIPDKRYSIGFVTSSAESNLAIMTACAPALWPLARRWFPSVFSRMALSQAFKQDALPSLRLTRDDRSAKTRSWDSHRRLVAGGGSNGGHRRGASGDGLDGVGRLASREPDMVDARGGRIVHTTKIWVKYDGDSSSEASSPQMTDLEAQLDEDSRLHPIELEPVFLCDYHQHIRAEARRSRSPW